MVIRRIIDEEAHGIIVGEHWDCDTRDLYVALRGYRGDAVRVHIFQDRGTTILGGLHHQGCSTYKQDDLPPYIHCPKEFIAALTPPETEEAGVWRQVAINWRTRFEHLSTATGKAGPGSSIILSDPKSGKRYVAVVDQFRALRAGPDCTWSSIQEIVDLPGMGTC